MDLQTAATALIGAVTPVIVHLIRLKLLPWNGKAAQALSFVVAGLLVIAAMVAQGLPLTAVAVGQNLAIVFTISQLVYRQVQNTLETKLG